MMGCDNVRGVSLIHSNRLKLLRPAAMTTRGLMFLLLSGCVLVCHLQFDGLVRIFHDVRESKNWSEAQHYCREKFTDLATIHDLTHNTKAQQEAGEIEFWIGLFYGTWKWSEEESEVSIETWFTSWATNEPRLNCVTISEAGTWFTKDCGALHSLMCYNAENQSHILVEKMMSWSDAQTYCRSMYTDLSSIRSQEENQKISSLLSAIGETPVIRDSSEEDDDEGSEPTKAKILIWIGLHRHAWMWSDHSNASYRRLAFDQHDENTDCVTMRSTGDWYAAICSEKHYFLCYTDVRPSLLRYVKLQLNGGPADLKDLNDPTMQDAILQQLEQKLEEAGIREDVKLRWRIQPDGRVFHREEESSPTGGQEEETVCDSLVGKPGIK